jgi:hypothetical protein
MSNIANQLNNIAKSDFKSDNKITVVETAQTSDSCSDTSISFSDLITDIIEDHCPKENLKESLNSELKENNTEDLPKHINTELPYEPELEASLFQLTSTSEAKDLTSIRGKLWERPKINFNEKRDIILHINECAIENPSKYVFNDIISTVSKGYKDESEPQAILISNNEIEECIDKPILNDTAIEKKFESININAEIARDIKEDISISYHIDTQWSFLSVNEKRVEPHMVCYKYEKAQDIYLDQVCSQISTRISSLKNEQGQTKGLKVQLQPAHLGYLEISLTSDINGTKINFSCEKKSTRLILEQNSNHVVNLLKNAGIEMNGAQLDFRDYRRDRSQNNKYSKSDVVMDTNLDHDQFSHSLIRFENNIDIRNFSIKISTKGLDLLV